MVSSVPRIGPMLTRSWVSNGLTLALHAVPVLGITLVLALVDALLPDQLPDPEVLARDSLWHDIGGMLMAATPRVIGWSMVGFVLQAVMGCWFTAESIQLRQAAEKETRKPAGWRYVRWPTGFLAYAWRFLLAGTLVNLGFAILGLMMIGVASVMLWPGHPMLEKALPALLTLGLFPIFFSLLNFTLYWAYFSPSVGQALANAWRAWRRHGGKGYTFFGIRGFLDSGVGVVVPLVIFRLSLPYPLKLLLVAALISLFVMWFRGVGFEFKNTLFYDQKARRLRSLV